MAINKAGHRKNNEQTGRHRIEFPVLGVDRSSDLLFQPEPDGGNGSVHRANSTNLGSGPLPPSPAGNTKNRRSDIHGRFAASRVRIKNIMRAVP